MIAVTWTSATGHPLHEAVSIHVLSFHVTSFPLFPPLSLFMIIFSFFLCHSLFPFLILVFPSSLCNLFFFTLFSKPILVPLLLV